MGFIFAFCRLYFVLCGPYFSTVYFFCIVWTLVLYCAGFIVSVVAFIFALSLLELCIVCTCIVAFALYCCVLCTCVVVWTALYIEASAMRSQHPRVVGTAVQLITLSLC